MTSGSLPWPDGRQAAVSLTFDDGLISQRTVAAPLLQAHDLRGTFYLVAGEDYATGLTPWVDTALAGHEIGNHTVGHPCSQNFAFVRADGRRTLDAMTVVDMDAELRLAQQRLRAVLPLSQPNSFAYPCYQPYVGRGADHASYVPLVAEQFVAGRGLGEAGNHPRYCDLAYLWSWPCERRSGAEMIGLVERAAVEGEWVILTFHGINEGNLSVAASDLHELCAHLARNRGRIWTAPVATVAQQVAAWQVR